MTVLDEFTQTVQFNEGQYEGTLPWKDSYPLLPNNFVLRSKCLHSLLHRLRQTFDILCECHSIIKSQLRQEIAKESDQPSHGVSGRGHYLPHHAVLRADKKTMKLWIIYDASAKSIRCSLNECVLKGRSLTRKFLTSYFDSMLIELH